MRVRAFLPVMLPELPLRCSSNFFSLHSQGISNLKLCEIIVAVKEKTKKAKRTTSLGKQTNAQTRGKHVATPTMHTHTHTHLPTDWVTAAAAGSGLARLSLRSLPATNN